MSCCINTNEQKKKRFWNKKIKKTEILEEKVVFSSVNNLTFEREMRSIFRRNLIYYVEIEVVDRFWNWCCCY